MSTPGDASRTGLRAAVVAATVVAALGITPLVVGQSPAGCRTNNWDMALTAAQRVAVDGTPLDYTITVSNAGAGACDVTGADVELTLPDGSTLTLATGTDFPAGGTPVMYRARYAADEAEDAVAGLAATEVTAAGRLETEEPRDVTITERLEIRFAHPEIAVDAGPDRAVAADATARLEATIRNTGDVDLERVVIDDAAYDECDSMLETLAAGEEVVVDCTVAQVTESATRGVTVRAAAAGNVAAVVEAVDEAAVTLLASGVGRIGDLAWFDGDGDGRQDLGERGAAGVEVILFTASGEEVARTVTTDAGLYLFREVPAGDYLLEFTLTGDLAPVPAGRGDAEVDSDIGPDGRTQVFTLGPGADDRSRDAGFLAPDVEILPETGLGTGPAAAAGVLSLLTGAGLLAVSRRRR